MSKNNGVVQNTRGRPIERLSEPEGRVSEGWSGFTAITEHWDRSVMLKARKSFALVPDLMVDISREGRREYSVT